jgi:hypothetical protein
MGLALIRLGERNQAWEQCSRNRMGASLIGVNVR